MQLIHQLLDLPGQVALKLEQSAHRLGLCLRLTGVQAGAAAEHGVGNLVGDDGADLVEVFPDGLDLADGPHQEFEVGFEIVSDLERSLTACASRGRGMELLEAWGELGAEESEARR